MARRAFKQLERDLLSKILNKTKQEIMVCPTGRSGSAKLGSVRLDSEQ